MEMEVVYWMYFYSDHVQAVIHDNLLKNLYFEGIYRKHLKV